MLGFDERRAAQVRLYCNDNFVRLRIKYKRRSDTYDVCRFVHIALRFDRKNLFLVIKFKQTTDLYKYLKIRLTDQEKEVDSNPSSVLLGQNVLQLLQQFNAITTVNLVIK